MLICLEAVINSLECCQFDASSREDCAEGFVVSKCAARLVKEDLLYASPFEKGDHTLHKRALCATWGFEILK